MECTLVFTLKIEQKPNGKTNEVGTAADMSYAIEHNMLVSRFAGAELAMA